MSDERHGETTRFAVDVTAPEDACCLCGYPECPQKVTREDIARFEERGLVVRESPDGG